MKSNSDWCWYFLKIKNERLLCAISSLSISIFECSYKSQIVRSTPQLTGAERAQRKVFEWSRLLERDTPCIQRLGVELPELNVIWDEMSVKTGIVFSERFGSSDSLLARG